MSPTNIWIALLKNSECFSHLQFFHPRKKGIQQFTFRGIFAPWSVHRYWYFHFMSMGCVCIAALSNESIICKLVWRCAGRVWLRWRENLDFRPLSFYCVSVFHSPLGIKPAFSHTYFGQVFPILRQKTRKKKFICVYLFRFYFRLSLTATTYFQSWKHADFHRNTNLKSSIHISNT